MQLAQHDDLEVKVDACWALSFLADGPQNQIQAVIDSGIIPYLVPQLQNTEPKIVMPALRTLGNIVTGSDAQTQVMCYVFGAQLKFHVEWEVNIAVSSCMKTPNISNNM